MTTYRLAVAVLVAAISWTPSLALETPRALSETAVDAGRQPDQRPTDSRSALVIDPMRQNVQRPDLTGRGPLFIWNNPTSPHKAGISAGLQVWIGDNPTPTPGPNDTVGGTIAVINGNNRGALWGMNIFTQSCRGCGPGFVDAKTTGLEIEAGTGYTGTPRDPWGGGPRKDGIELTAQSGSADRLTSAVMVYANDNTGKGWWNTGFALSRVYEVGLLAKADPTDADRVPAFQTAVLYDQSDSRATIKVGSGRHRSVLDLSEATASAYTILGARDRDTNLVFGNAADHHLSLALDSGRGEAREANLDFTENGRLRWRTGKGADGAYRIDDVALGSAPLVISQGSNTATMHNVVATETLRVPFGTPGSAKATCRRGELRMDASYVYACTADDTWRRSPVGSAW